MNYPYPIPGSGSAPIQSPENWFEVGNECCNGSIWKDVEATVRVFFDYSQAMANVVGGNTITSVSLTITPVGDEMIIIPSQSFASNLQQFLVAGGLVGAQYGIEALASLTDGQVWVDHITINITDCGANISSGPGGSGGLLSTFGPIVISNTLYYAAAGGQTVFSLGIPDKFGHVGALADSNVLVYEAGGRQVPYDNYNVSVGGNSVTFISPLSAGEIVVFDLVSPAPPAPVIPPPILLESGIISTTLYYTALDGQTVFNLGTPDEFNNVGIMTANGVQVYRSGNRLTFTDGYTLNVSSNIVTLAYPAGNGEPIIIELTTPPPPPPTLGGTIPKMENLTIVTSNVFPNLAFPPDGALLMLFINGQAFFPPTSFTVSGQTLTWVSTLFSVPPGAAVIAVYTHV